MSAKRDLLAIFPGALGDFLCFLPTLIPLAGSCEATLVAKPQWLELLQWPRLRALAIDRAEISALFGDAPLTPEVYAALGSYACAESWSGDSVPAVRRRLGEIAARVRVHKFQGMADGEHAIDYYARTAGVIPASSAAVAGALHYDHQWLTELEDRVLHGRPAVVLHAGSGSRRKNWTGFGELVRRRSEWIAGAELIVVRGPAELERGEQTLGDHQILAPVLPQLAALLRRARVYIGNDSGVTHLAAAVGTKVIALFADTDARVWAPRGDVHLLRAAAPCELCGTGVFCTHRLATETVADAILTYVSPCGVE